MAKGFTCKHCGNQIISHYLAIGEEAVCAKCNMTTPIPGDADDIEADPSTTPSIVFTDICKADTSNNDLETRYHSMRIIIGFFKVAGWITLVIGVIVSIGLIAKGGSIIIFMGIGALALSAISSLFCFANAASIQVVCDIEQNTRDSHSALESISNELAKRSLRSNSVEYKKHSSDSDQSDSN